MGALPSRTLPARGGLGAPTGVGGLEHGADPSIAAGRIRLWGTRVLFVVSSAALVSLIRGAVINGINGKKIEFAVSDAKSSEVQNPGTSSSAPTERPPG